MRRPPEFHMFRNVILRRKLHVPKWSVPTRKCISQRSGRYGAIMTSEGARELLHPLPEFAHRSGTRRLHRIPISFWELPVTALPVVSVK